MSLKISKSTSHLFALTLLGIVSGSTIANDKALNVKQDIIRPGSGAVIDKGVHTQLDNVVKIGWFDGQRLTRDFARNLTKDTKRDLLYFSDCSAGIEYAKELGLELMAPSASGCLYLAFGSPDSLFAGEYRAWDEYWLIDEPCAGKQRNGCFLGYLIDTRINNTVSNESSRYEVTVESSHEFWSTQPVVANVRKTATA